MLISTLVWHLLPLRLIESGNVDGSVNLPDFSMLCMRACVCWRLPHRWENAGGFKSNLIYKLIFYGWVWRWLFTTEQWGWDGVRIDTSHIPVSASRSAQGTKTFPNIILMAIKVYKGHTKWAGEKRSSWKMFFIILGKRERTWGWDLAVESLS